MATAVLVAVAGCSPDKRPESSATAVTLASSDGLKIAASLLPATLPAPPGLILVHMYGSDHSAWESFAGRAQREGYSTIAIDMRGHGDSASMNSAAPKYGGFSTEDWRGVLLDIDAARQALIASGVDEDRIGIVGASIGANLAAAYAAKNEDLQALVMLSPGTDYKGIRVTPSFETYGKRPSLLLTSEDDRYSAQTCRSLHASAAGFCELREFPGADHGTDLLDASPNAAGLILQWCDTVLGEAPAP